MQKILTFCLCLGFFQCQTDKKQAAIPAYYFWKTTFKLNADQKQKLQAENCKRLYIKYLDIGVNDENGRTEPVSYLQIVDTSGITGLEIVPSVFITNEVFDKERAKNSHFLAEKIANAIQKIHQKFPNHPIKEVQFDCDWTAGTQTAFFNFLYITKNNFFPNCDLSATIRLHQYKFPKKTGVPPVNRGILMLYNTGDLDNWACQNSIFDAADAEKYLSGNLSEYPLPLDIALPDFSWALIFRNGQFFKIINELRSENLTQNPCFHVLAPNRFEVIKPTILNGIALLEGDLVRTETVTETDLAAVRKYGERVKSVFEERLYWAKFKI